MKFGFIGLGDMGLNMARRLLDTGHDVIAWNRSTENLDRLVEEGAFRARSPADVIARVDLIGLCVSSDPAVEEVAWGAEGLFSAPLDGDKFVANFSTGCPKSAMSFAKRAEEYNSFWIDAPVSGGVPAAIAGTLIIFAGGTEKALSALDPLLIPLAKRVSHMGSSGSGQATKICNQMIVACNMLVIAETITMARKAGVDVAGLPKALEGGFADSAPLQIFGPRMAARQFEPRLGAIELMEKDVGLASVMATEARAGVPILNLVHTLYAKVRDMSNMDIKADLSTLIGLYEDLEQERLSIS